jgi:hypothetical protein
MRFQVPQFLEIEDKLFGPLTFKQFIYVAGGIGISAVIFMLLPTFIAILLSTPVVVFGLALAFYRVNEKPFIEVVEAFIKFHTSGQLYLWQKEEKVPTSANRVEKPLEQVYVPKLSQSKLKDLTWSLDIKENNNPVNEKDGDPRFS